MGDWSDLRNSEKSGGAEEVDGIAVDRRDLHCRTPARCNAMRRRSQMGAFVTLSAAFRSVGRYGPISTIFAIEGTPEVLRRKSMYGPGGASLPLAGA